MRDFPIAIIVAAATAAVVAVLTEPNGGLKNIQQSGNGDIAKTAVKGNRLDRRPTADCSLTGSTPYNGGNRARGLREPTRPPSEGRIVIVRSVD